MSSVASGSILSGFPSDNVRRGDEVVLSGLEDETLNGRVGTVTGFHRRSGTISVCLGQDETELIPPENLVPIRESERVSARLSDRQSVDRESVDRLSNRHSVEIISDRGSDMVSDRVSDRQISDSRQWQSAQSSSFGRNSQGEMSNDGFVSLGSTTTLAPSPTDGGASTDGKANSSMAVGKVFEQQARQLSSSSGSRSSVVSHHSSRSHRSQQSSASRKSYRSQPEASAPPSLPANFRAPSVQSSTDKVPDGSSPQRWRAGAPVWQPPPPPSDPIPHVQVRPTEGSPSSRPSSSTFRNDPTRSDTIPSSTFRSSIQGGGMFSQFADAVAEDFKSTVDDCRRYGVGRTLTDQTLGMVTDAQAWLGAQDDSSSLGDSASQRGPNSSRYSAASFDGNQYNSNQFSNNRYSNNQPPQYYRNGLSANVSMYGDDNYSSPPQRPQHINPFSERQHTQEQHFREQYQRQQYQQQQQELPWAGPSLDIFRAWFSQGKETAKRVVGQTSAAVSLASHGAQAYSYFSSPTPPPQPVVPESNVRWQVLALAVFTCLMLPWLVVVPNLPIAFMPILRVSSVVVCLYLGLVSQMRRGARLLLLMLWACCVISSVVFLTMESTSSFSPSNFSPSNARDYLYNSKLAEQINDQRKKIRFRLPWTYDRNEGRGEDSDGGARSSVAQLRSGSVDSGSSAKDGAVHPAWRWLRKARNAWMTRNEYPFGQSSADYEENMDDDNIVEM